MSVSSVSLLNRLDLFDLERIRLLLSGDSVVDWSRLHCHHIDDVDALLMRVGLDFDEPEDRLRIDAIHGQAVGYLETHGYGVIHEAIRSPEDVRRLFVFASGVGEFQRDACSVLKVMHIIHHAAGRELVKYWRRGWRLRRAKRELRNEQQQAHVRVYEYSWRGARARRQPAAGCCRPAGSHV